jgi:hypothetical protein
LEATHALHHAPLLTQDPPLAFVDILLDLLNSQIAVGLQKYSELRFRGVAWQSIAVMHGRREVRPWSEQMRSQKAVLAHQLLLSWLQSFQVPGGQ